MLMADDNRRRMLAIDDLTDDDLLTVFDFYVFKYQGLDFIEDRKHDIKREIEAWTSLVQVCRRWRGLVFGSPRRLNLQLYYDLYHDPRTSAKKCLDVWPALPLFIRGDVTKVSVNDAIAVLEHGDRICRIDLVCHKPPQLEKIWSAMQVPFPELVDLRLSLRGSSSLPDRLPDSLLGGSAPRLRTLRLDTVPYLRLPKLLLYATHLVKIHLHDIPFSELILPDAMATSLSTLTSLEVLHLGFVSPRRYSGLKSRSPIRSALPTLSIFSFCGTIKYLGEFVDRINTPRLSTLSTEFFNDMNYETAEINDMVFDTPELNQFISRTPTLGPYDEAHLFYDRRAGLARVGLRQSHPGPSDPRTRSLEIETSYQEFPIVARICTLLLRLLLTIENLYIDGGPPSWNVDDGDNSEWLDLLLPFKTVKNLYISEKYSTCIALVLQELTGERTTQVLPTLQNILLGGLRPSNPVQEGIMQFISARQLTNHPVAISVWD